MGTAQPAEQIGLFDFLRLVSAALGRGQLTRMQASVAVLTALDSDGTTGTGIYLNADKTAVELGISERQVWRHFNALVKGRWFEQTAAPARPGADGGGRRARYRCLWPLLDLGQAVNLPQRLTDPAANTSDVTTDQRLTDSSANTSDVGLGTPSASDGFTGQRLTVFDPASDIAEPESGTLPTSDGPTTDGPTIVLARGEQAQDAREVDDPPQSHLDRAQLLVVAVLDGEEVPADTSRDRSRVTDAVSHDTAPHRTARPDPRPRPEGSRTGPGQADAAPVPCRHWDNKNDRPSLTPDGTCYTKDCKALDLCPGCVRLSRWGEPAYCDLHRETG